MYGVCNLRKYVLRVQSSQLYTICEVLEGRRGKVRQVMVNNSVQDGCKNGRPDALQACQVGKK